MKALVTGATGFTGSYLVDNLLANGYEVRAFARPTSNLAELERRKVEIRLGFLESQDDVMKASENIDVIYHIAALYRSANVPDADYWEVNVKGTNHVLEAALINGVKKVVHCSTAGVHGHVKNPPGNESSPLNPGDIYQITKVEGEKIAMRYYKEKGLPVTIVRPIGIYGPGDTRMLKFYRMVQKRKFIMFGNGKALYHLTFVTDTVEGIRLAGENPNSAGQIYIIGGENYFTLADFANQIANVLDVPSPKVRLPVWPLYGVAWLCEKVCIPLRVQPPIFRRRVDIFTKDRAFDISKAKNELGFQPKTDIAKGIKKTAQWYKEHHYLD